MKLDVDQLLLLFRSRNSSRQKSEQAQVLSIFSALGSLSAGLIAFLTFLIFQQITVCFVIGTLAKLLFIPIFGLLGKKYWKSCLRRKIKSPDRLDKLDFIRAEFESDMAAIEALNIPAQEKKDLLVVRYEEYSKRKDVLREQILYDSRSLEYDPVQRRITR